ncbi:MAG: VOC family protein [Deltaproteobacteria bacterium]|nr:VOC family protein [Deltaproteobacteria bacterium]
MTTIASYQPGTIGWFDLMTSDTAAARAFYAGLFGWQIDVGPPEFGGYAMCMNAGRTAAGLGPIEPGSPQPPSWSVYFITPDADATAARITAHGGELIVPPMDVGEEGRMLVARDATGAVFGAWQPGAHHGAQCAHEPGAMAWAEVNTRDSKRAREFYAAVFDLEPHHLEAPGIEYWTLHRGDETVGGVLQMDAHWPASVPPHWMAYLQVADTDAACARIKELGGKVCVPPFDSPYGRIAVVEDPQGATFSVMHPPEGHAG